MVSLNIIPLIVIIICIKCDIIYESPIFCLKNDDKSQAKQIYEYIYKP